MMIVASPYRAAFAAGMVLSSACAVGVEKAPEIAPNESAPVEMTRLEGGVVYATLLAEVRLADDHVLQFFQRGETTFGMRESLPIEREDERVSGDDGYAAAYLRAIGSSDPADVPATIQSAEGAFQQRKHLATQDLQPSASAAALPQPTEIPIEPALGVTAQALQAQAECSVDSEPNGDFGATWFLQNFCTEGGPYRGCMTNRRRAQTEQMFSSHPGFVSSSNFKAYAMAGDFNVPATFRVYRVPEDWNGAMAPALVWDVPVQPRTVEAHTWTDYDDFTQWKSYVECPCNHAHIAYIFGG